MKKQLQKISLFSSLFLSVGMSAFGQIPNYVPTNGLVGWWPFNGNANDESGNANNGTVNGATLTTDRFGNTNAAYYFSSSGCATRIDANVNTSSIQTGLTISVWLCKIGNGCVSPRLFEFWPGADGPGSAQWGWANSATLIGMGSTTSNGFNCAYGVPVQPLNQWTHLVYTNDGMVGKFYQDGILLGSVISSGNPILASNLAIGRMNHPSFDAFNGKIDDFGVWNRALSECEVAGLFNSAVTTPPTVNLGSDTLTICGLNTTLDATNSAAGTYSWNTGETTPSITVSSSGEYHVTVTDTAGCASSDSVYVSVIDPTITAGQSAFCLGDSTTLSVNNVGGNSCGNLPSGFENGLVGRWSFCGNANDESGNGNNGVVTGATLSSDRFGNANSAYHFDGNDFIKVNSIYDYPNKTINCWFNASEIFQNGNNSYQILSIDAQTLNHGMTSAQLESGQISIFAGGENNPFFTPIDSNQWYMLTLVRNTTNVEYYLNGILLGSNNSGTITSTSNDNENLLIGVDRSEIVQFFKGNIDDIGIWNRALTQQEIEQLFSHGNLSSWWSDGTTNQTSIHVQPTQNTTYSVTVSDGVGSCTDSITIQVNNPQINAGPDISVCAGDSTTLTATGASTYAWDNGVVNGQTFVPIVEGYYNVTGTDTLGCSNSVSIFVDLLQPTSSSISPVNCVTYTAPDGAVYTNSGQYTAVIPNAAGCDSTISINLTINNASSGTDTKVACDTYTWIDGVTYTENNTSATYTLQNAVGCDSVVTLNLTINKLLNLNAGNDQVVCKGENVILAASGADTYNWNNGISDGVAFSPPLGTTTYTVTGTDGNGCTDTDEVVVTSDYCFEIPGALSPNGDNNNDTWEITGLSNYPNAQVTVFDRWGQKVYEGSNASTPWNGKYNEKDLPTADYYYVIELGNGDKYNGVVTLKR
jgi:gliding motility-associated-like protein